MAPGVPRGEDAAGGTWRSERDSGALQSPGQGGKEDPERGTGFGAGAPQVSAGGPRGPRRPPPCAERAAAGTREARADSPSPLPRRVPAPASGLTSSPAGSPPPPPPPFPHPARPFSSPPRPLPQTSSRPSSRRLLPHLRHLPLPQPRLASPCPHPPFPSPLPASAQPQPSASGHGPPQLASLLLLKARPASRS